MRKNGAASAPQPAVHCQPRVLLARSASTRVIPEPAGTLLPGDQQVLHEKGGDHHADAVVHPARGPEFAHAGVHERAAGLTALPGTEPGGVLPPGEPGELSPQRLLRRMGEVEKQMVRKLTPAQLGEELPLAPHRRGNGLRLGESFHRVPHLARADLAEVQVRREARRADEVRPVAAIGVGQETLAQEAPKLGFGTGTAGVPGSAQAGGPVEVWTPIPARPAAATAGRRGGAARRRGAGSGSAGSAEARQVLQKGVKTWKGRPALFWIVQGSYSSAALQLSVCSPAARRAASTFRSRAMLAGS